MKLLAALALALTLLTLPAHAATLGACDGLDSIGNLISQTKSFSQSAVKVAYVSTEEPAAHPDHLLVFVYGDEMSVTCVSVNAGPENSGFGSIAFDKLTSSYDAVKGLLLTVPADVWAGEDGKYNKELVKVRVNQNGGREPKVTLE